MTTAYDMGMTNGDYVFIIMNLFPANNFYTLWAAANTTNTNTAKKAFFPLMQVFCDSM
jgi:hypothetical protein